MSQFRRNTLASALLLGVFVACGGDTIPTVVLTTTTTTVDTTTKTPPPPVVAAVQVTATPKLTVGRTGTVTAVAKTSQNVDVTGKTFAFSSNNTNAVTVSATGTLTAVGPGTAVISAATDGVTGTATVVATDASLFAMTISPTSRTMYVTNTQQFTVAGKDSSGAAVAVRTTTWKSSNDNIATVSTTGLVTAKALGTATISVEGITNTAITATATITVVPVPVASVVIAPVDTILRFRFPRQLVATTRDTAGGILGRPVKFTSSNVDVALLDDFGLATATGEGPVTITATSEGKSASVRLYVVADSGAYVVVTGGRTGDFVTAAIDIPNATSSGSQTRTIGTDTTTRFDIITSNGAYRARAFTVGDPARVGAPLSSIALQLGAVTTPLAITNGPPSTVFNILLKPYTATINAPATAAVNSTVTVSWTFDESTQPFSFYPDALPAGILWYSTTNGNDLTGSAVGATVTRDANGITTFTATFTAPSTPGPVYIQVEGDGAITKLLYPIKFNGTAYRIINVQ